MTAFAAEDAGPDLRRWLLSAAAVVLAHGAVAAGIMSWREPPEAPEPAAAIVIEFAPLPVGPATPVAEIAPGPEQVMSAASPTNPVDSRESKAEEESERKVESKRERIADENESRPVEQPAPDIAPAPNPEVAFAPPPPRQQQEVRQRNVRRQEPRTPALTTSAPQAVPEQTAPVPAAPEQGPLAPQTSRSLKSWQMQVVTLLERNKRYPPAAQSRREQGIAQLLFSLDRQGRLVESRVLRSSGAAALDQEALALVRRAQPFPPPPPELAGERVRVTVPIRFNLK